MSARFLQSIQISSKHSDEIAYVPLFIAVITVNKYVLSVLRYTVPTVFQGWQTLFCVLSLSLLIKLQKIKNDLHILDRQSNYLIIPWLITYAASLVTGSRALADLPVPVFLAFSNLIPAVLILLDKKNDEVSTSVRVCGSIVICGTIITILLLNITPFMEYLYMLGFIALTLLHTLYMDKIQLNLNDMTKIYYRNFFSVVVLFPISIYLDVLHFPSHLNTWEFYVGCLLSGILGTVIQFLTGKIETKSTFLSYQGLAKLLCSLLAYEIFFANIEPIVWFLIIINLSAGMLALNEYGKESEGKTQSVVIVQPPIKIVSTVEKSREGY